MDKKNIIIGLILVVVSFGVGYFATPTKVTTKEVVKEVKVKDEQKAKIVYKEKIVYKDGTVVEKETSQEQSSTKESSNTEVSRASETTKDAGLSLAVLGIVDANNIKGTVNYGLHVQKRFIGNVTLGALATTDKKVGLSVGLEF